MRKSNPYRNVPSGNALKADSYQEAWKRIDDAIDREFFLEAITLEESIMSDRLLSYVLGVGPITKQVKNKADSDKYQKIVFAALIDEVKDIKEIHEDLDAWRIRRNKAVHAAAKSFPGTPTVSVDQFLQMAKDTAEDGKKLTRRICNWHRQQLKLAKC